MSTNRTAPSTTFHSAYGTPAVPATGQGKAAGPVLVAATIAMGLMAGLFFAFDVSVMPVWRRVTTVRT